MRFISFEESGGVLQGALYRPYIPFNGPTNKAAYYCLYCHMVHHDPCQPNQGKPVLSAMRQKQMQTKQMHTCIS